MKRSSLFALIIFASSFTFGQQLAPFGKLLERYYPTMNETDEALVWVYFRDKGPGVEQRLSLAPQAYLSERSVERRQKALRSQRIIDFDDLPLEHSYVRAVEPLVMRVRHEVTWFNAVSVFATKRQIEQLRHLSFVKEIELVGRWKKRDTDIEEVRSMPPPLMPQHLNAVPMYNYGNSLTQNNQINVIAVHNLGIIGQGVLIGIFDAGVSYPNHPAIATRPVIAHHDFITNRDSLTWYSHGENTFSTVGGYSEGNLIGPAFGASFVLARTEDAATETPIEEDSWARAIIWADSIGIDVASTSLGYNGFDFPWPGYTWQDMDGNTTVITRAADRASSLGIVIVNSAGNSGDIGLPANTLGAPSDGFNVIAAGAVDGSGNRVSFSSVGPSADGRIKPDVMAMGSGVYVASGASGYGYASGTSFSCPLSAGVAALVVCADSDFALTPFQVREAMRQTASRANVPDRYYGWGILDALRAINYAWIAHAPLQATEDTTARTVTVTIKSRDALTADSTRVVYGLNGSFTGSALLASTGSPNEYSAQIPYLGSDVRVTYYIQAKNSYVTTRDPLDAPGGYYSYYVQQDTSGPAIVHAPLGNQSWLAWPAKVVADISDRSGVDSAWVEYSVNGLSRSPFLLSLNQGNYSDTFHVSRSEIGIGDTILYRIAARDGSMGSHVSMYPSSGYIQFVVANFVNANENFRNNNGGFTGTNDWQWGEPSGTSPQPFSPTRYWGTNLAGNYSTGPLLSTLTTRTYTVFSDRASFSFWRWYEIQSRFDGANVKVSINGAPFQTVSPVGGYPEGSIYSGFGNPLGGQPGFSNVGGNSWTKASFDLTGIAFVGDTAAIRFDFGADNSIQYRGWYIDDFATDGIGTVVPARVEEAQTLPRQFALRQNFPNPFNTATVIRYSLPVASYVTLKVYNLLGMEVASLVNEQKQAGEYSVRWNAGGLASGVYFYRLTAGSFRDTRKLLLLR